IRAGKTSFMFACQPGMIKSLTRCYGATYAEARDADISGCNEMHVKGDEASMTDLLPNAAKALLLALNDGFDPVTGTQLGPKTGDLALMESYGDFYSAFIAQLSFIIDSSLDLSDRLDRLVDQINPCVLLSALSPRALEEARDVYAYGAKYTNSAVLICSFATAVDSLMAVKKLVFDLKEVDAATLKDALAADWNGYEKLRLRAKRLEQKYGNGEEESDECAAKLSEWLFDHLSKRRNSRGGAVKLGVPSTSDYISQGKKLPATPDGRRAGEELSKNVAPVNGAEKNGVTGYIRSALKLVPTRFSEAFVLDAMIHPSAIAGDDGIAAVRSLIKTYMALDGISIQFNVFSPEMLLDAQAHPEKYSDLQVRVTGWNALWNGMTKKEQDAYIERSFSIAASPGA
ncbi:MAG: hypothetical protein IJV00_05055, partial [Clostridia bacterium]|nr:hypothetical protein [Clostridia bacterium]